MCGIVGMAGAVTYQHLAAFKDMLAVCQVRGRDSTGAVRVKPDNEYLWAKMVGPPEMLLDTKSYDKMIDVAPTKALIGHCRAKTVGEAKTRNAHPFDFPGKVIGVHNGTLKGYYSMERNRDFDVDSELLYWHIGEYGVQETVSKLDADGAWCLVYWDAQKNTLNFLRNDKRPLFFTHSEDKKVMYWASEPWMFNVISRRPGMKLWDGEGESVFYPLPTDTLFSYSIDHAKTKPQDIFTLHQPVEIKGEVRSYAGNLTTRVNHGYSGNNSGGSVTSPFRKPGELDDSIVDLTNRVNASRGQHLPLPGTTKNQEGLTRTPTSSGTSTPSSQSPSDSKTDSKNLNGIERQKLSLVSTTSNVPLLENKGGSTNTSTGCSTTCNDHRSPVKLVSFRSVLGQKYVTDNKTSTEYSEHRFDEETGGICSFCKSPIGDMEEVHEIFHLTDMMGHKELAFLCDSCVVPAVA